ncbi:hypothetical protein GCM10010910_01380 [Microbacterium nanhaiense]|uniref:DUF222 domain-containing protein n=1 Tax=Microbacterium nanhaiense TaxID=1301026 RepID=A0ABQ2MVK6_9MICO|nr:hypothetical protein [Microbacterium nanhaiense]GGO59134.1 hypothetical protein GCM10010910_01380 [Microbacterium nanhaiense]
MSDLLSRVEARVMPSEDVLICLDLALLDARQEALADLDRARRTNDRPGDERLVTPKVDVSAFEARLADITDAIRDASIRIRIRGVDRNTYNGWLSQCPARKGKSETFDQSKFFMIAARGSGVYVDADGAEHDITEDEWAAIDATLTDGEYDRLAAAIIAVNRAKGSVDVAPFVSGSETTRDSFGISVSPAPSGSRRAASGAGSPKKSTPRKSTRGARTSE